MKIKESKLTIIRIAIIAVLLFFVSTQSKIIALTFLLVFISLEIMGKIISDLLVDMIKIIRKIDPDFGQKKKDEER